MQLNQLLLHVECAQHGTIGMPIAVRVEERAQLLPALVTIANTHVARHRCTVTIVTLDTSAGDAGTSRITIEPREPSRKVPFKRLQVLINNADSDVAEMATELINHRVEGVLDAIDEAVDDAEWARVSQMPIEDVRAELLASGYTDAAQVSHVGQVKQLISVSLVRNQLIVAKAHLAKTLGELREYAEADARKRGKRLRDLAPSLASAVDDLIGPSAWECRAPQRHVVWGGKAACHWTEEPLPVWPQSQTAVDVTALVTRADLSGDVQAATVKALAAIAPSSTPDPDIHCAACREKLPALLQGIHDLFTRIGAAYGAATEGPK